MPVGQTNTSAMAQALNLESSRIRMPGKRAFVNFAVTYYVIWSACLSKRSKLLKQGEVSGPLHILLIGHASSY